MIRDLFRFLASDFLRLQSASWAFLFGVLITQRVKFLHNFSIPNQ